MAHSLPELAIDAEGLARRFGARWVLRGVTLQVRPGEIVGLLGANGSGKTTLLRIFATLLRPSAGSATIFGHDLRESADVVRAHVGLFAHTPGLYDDLTARENLVFAAAMLGLQADRVDAALERVGLRHVAGDRVRGFSAGMQRRLSLARLLLARRRLLLVDEPYANLDVDGVALMNEVILESARAGGAALLVLHERTPAAAVLGRTVSLHDGRIRTGGDAGPLAAPLAAAATG